MNALTNWLRRKQPSESARVAGIVARTVRTSDPHAEGELSEEVPVGDVTDAEQTVDAALPEMPANAFEEPPEDLADLPDDRRLQVRVYNHWRELLGNARFPSIEDLDPAGQPDFAPYSVLIDYTAGIDNPAVAYVGDALAEECFVDRETTRVADIPRDSVLGRIASQSAQVFGNEAPIGFEAEFTDRNGADVPYRGILLPFSSDNETIDFIFGVVNWKKSVAEAEEPVAGNFPPLPETPEELFRPQPTLATEVATTNAPEPEELDHDALVSQAEPLEIAPAPALQVEATGSSITDCVATFDAPQPLVPSLDEEAVAAPVEVPAPTELQALFLDARALAEAALRDESGQADPLCEAIGKAYDFALSAGGAPDEFARLAAEQGLPVTGRAPVGAIVRLVFAGHEPSHMAGYASCLVQARKQRVSRGQLAGKLRNEPELFSV